MRRNIDGSCSGDPCCRNPNIRTINTMNADTQGNFTITGGPAVIITTVTNGIKIDYTGGLVFYTNTDGNLVIDPDNLTIDFAEDIVIAGDLTVNGTYYTVHAEHVYTQDDYIIMRDGALAALGSGQYSGFQVKKYDGTNDGRLVIDNTGTARVGDVGDEQPLLTREESANLTDGALLKWDSANSKAVDEGTVGDDTHPIKIVNGVASPVSSTLAKTSDLPGFASGNLSLLEGSGAITYYKYGRIVVINLINYAPANQGVRDIANIPAASSGSCYGIVKNGGDNTCRLVAIESGKVRVTVIAGDTSYIGQVIYTSTS